MTFLFRSRGRWICCQRGALGELLDAMTEVMLIQRRAYDMLMMTLFNAREREMEDWIQLFEKADNRFKFKSAQKPDIGTMGVMIAVWEYEKA